MKETEDLLNKRILDLQNALIRQCVNQEKLKNDIDDFSERSDIFENLYNSTKRELYELEIKYKKLELESGSRYPNDFRKNNVNNLGSIELLKIVLIRLKNRLIRRKHEFS